MNTLDSSLNVNNYESDDLELVYPADIKVTKDIFSIYELKRKYDERKAIILDPEFQRKRVWSRKQKSELIESILMGIPLPVMYFAEDKYGNLQVVDGRQRLTALFEFMNDNSGFSISSAPILKHIKGKKYSDLTGSEQTKLEDYQAIVYIIKPQTPERIKFDIFDRVNRGGTQLNKQEMRNALYQGKATSLLKQLAQNDTFKKATDFGVASTRMKDRYLILRFIGFYLYKTGQLTEVEYKSDIDDFLGKVMQYINEVDDIFILELKDKFNKAMTNSLDILGKNAFRIPSDERKRPISMSLFECLSFLMINDIVQNDVNKTKLSLSSLFQDKLFMESLTIKIDSSKSVDVRFEKINTLIEELSNG